MAKQGKKTLAFGVFDGIHAGHIYYLKKAKALSGFLIVAVARDAPLWKIEKSHHLSQEERVDAVESLGIADKVILGGKEDSLELVMKLKPDKIALTKYSPIRASFLSKYLKKAGLECKVVEIPPYKPKIYDSFFPRAQGKKAVQK